ncbi:ankyrin repeat domain-containing protein [Turneriella parva]|uniref:Ankyrin n=1 Tax=Turneriella parva (strain ATCC BAA-1111 / DSM 21527 / NCTC 11395 / H) TaxID=869212 RepID=I4B0B7_TURPD|nr:ankyrin repeat domain-containing protein [Turneriella parva]AFM10724.1 Ankyrin [Turneriella parva DSM 21527]
MPKFARFLLFSAMLFGTLAIADSGSDLEKAISQRSSKKLRKLLKIIGPDTLISSPEGYPGQSLPALVYAVEIGDLTVVKTLLEAGASVDIRGTSEQLTPLILAACDGKNEVLQVLIEAKANLDLKTVPNEWARSYTSVSALACAANRNHREAYDLLIAAGAKEDFPLHSAVMLNDADLASRAIEQGANVDLVDGYLSSPLMHAVKKGNAELVRILLDAKASPDIPRQVSHETVDGRPRTTFSSTYLIGSEPIYVATKAKNVEIVRMLLEAKADPNVSDLSKHTPLWLAVEAGNMEIVRLLLVARASVNIKDRQGESLIDMAKRIKSDPQILQMLSEAKP